MKALAPSQENAGAQEVADFASDLSTGPANEDGQKLTGFNVTQTGGSLEFSTPPSIDTSGTLKYTAASNASGTATFDVTLTDDGGTKNGGRDTSATKSFTIMVEAALVNQAPVAQNDAFTTDEDSAVTGNVTADNGSGADSDPDGGPQALKVATVNGDGANVGKQITLASGALVTLNANGSFTYDPNGKFEDLNDGDTETDTFTYALTDGEDASNAATVSVTVNGVTDAPAQYTLSVDLQGAGAGTVNLNPPDENCNADCTQAYDQSTAVTLTAAPATDSTFSGWSGSCSGIDPCQVTMDAAKTVTATFDAVPPVQHTLTVSKSGDGTVTSTPPGIDCGDVCSTAFDDGTNVTLTAQPADGFTFEGWNGDCTSSPCTVIMNADKNVAATFSVIPAPQHTLSVDFQGSGAGTVVLTPPDLNCSSTCNETYTEGDAVNLTAIPADGSSFAGWSGAGCSDTCRVTMTQDQNVTATFDTTPAVVSVTVTPEQTTVDVGQTVQLAAEVNAVGDADQAVTWTSSDDNVANVDTSGLITGIGEGTAVITAASAFDPAQAGTATLTVHPVPTAPTTDVNKIRQDS